MSDPAHQPLLPMRDPDIPGRAPAWRIDMSGLAPRPDDAPVGDSYLLYSPMSHPAWHWHFISMVHLRDLPGQTRAPHRQFPGATHEIMCFALDPGKPLPDPDDWASRADGLFLQPPDWIIQFEAPSDEHALRVYETVLRAAIAGASVDSDLARFWRGLVETAAAHERGEEPRAPGSDPATREDYDQLAIANAQVSGYGILGVTQHLPCPFCAAPDWQVFSVIDVAASIAQPAMCENCGRTAKAIISDIEGGTKFEFVQTGGPDPPDYLPPMRRVEEP